MQVATIETRPKAFPIGSVDVRTFFHHRDHLGSASIDTSGGDVTAVSDYLPFGTTLNDQNYDPLGYDNAYKFTSQELDDETGLYYYDARYYDSDLGRFMAVDGAYLGVSGDKAMLVNPQKLNSYSYVYNNPLKYTDPSGNWGFTMTWSNPWTLTLLKIPLPTWSAPTMPVTLAPVFEPVPLVPPSEPAKPIPLESRLNPESTTPPPGWSGTKPPDGWDGSSPPGDGFDKRGGDDGGWYNPDLQESWRPDYTENHRFHYDYKMKKGDGYRYFPDSGTWQLKNGCTMDVYNDYINDMEQYNKDMQQYQSDMDKYNQQKEKNSDNEFGGYIQG